MEPLLVLGFLNYSIPFLLVVSHVYTAVSILLQLLEDIDLSGNRFDTIPVHAFQVLKNLRSVNISGCGIKHVPIGKLT